MTYKKMTTTAREIMKKKPEVEVEKPFDNKESEQVETPADRVMKKYASKLYRNAEFKKKIIDNT